MKKDTNQEKLAALLALWEDRRELGQQVSVEELTADAPELTEKLRAQVAQLEAMAWLDSDTQPHVSRRADNSDAVSSKPSPPALLAGRYRLERLIAEGGFAQVWRARDLTLQRSVAVKITTSECIDEAQRTAQLQHHGIVSVHDVGNEAGFCFIVFDLVEGSDLATRIEQDKLPWREAVALIIEIARHLQYAHEKCFIHRDIKPANILLNEQGRPILADFGIAITPCEMMHEVQTTAGTLAYMSPEQVSADQRLDARTDIYSLGVVLYELLAGNLPFQAKTLWELRRQILTEEPEPLEATLPAALERIVRKCLAKNPVDRFRSARGLADELQTVLQAGVQPSSLG